MLTLIFTILMICVFGKLFLFSLKAAWGIAKILLTLVFLPFTLIFMALSGLITLALPILIVVGVISFFTAPIRR